MKYLKLIVNNEKKGNLVLLGLAFGVIAITGVIVSL